MRKMVFLIFLCLLGFSISAWGAPVAYQGKIAYIHAGDVWVINPDGSKNLQLTRFGNCSYPVWSPDGTKILFLRGEQLWMMASDGREAALIPTLTDAAERPAWIPGKAEIAFGSLDLKAICAVSSSGGAHRVLARGKPYAWGPSFSCNGSFFVCFAGNHQEGMVARANFRSTDSSPASLIILSPGKASYPSLSPDGKKVVFVRDGALWIMSSGGKIIKKLAEARLYFCKMPSWSPDGSFIVFRSEDKKGFCLRIVNVGSGAVQILKTGFGDSSDPSWGK